MLAPMVFSWLAGKFLGGNKAGQPSSGGGLSDLLPGAGGDGQGGGGLGDLLGSVLGGAKTAVREATEGSPTSSVVCSAEVAARDLHPSDDEAPVYLRDVRGFRIVYLGMCRDRFNRYHQRDDRSYNDSHPCNHHGNGARDHDFDQRGH